MLSHLCGRVFHEMNIFFPTCNTSLKSLDLRGWMYIIAPMEKLNIAIICDSIDTTLGGSYISAQRFARWLSEMWHHIVWCTSVFRDTAKKKEFGYASVYEFPSIFPIWPQHVRFALPKIWSLVKIFKKEKIDIVYNIHPARIGWQAYRAAKKAWIPIVSHSHIFVWATFGRLPGFIQKRIKNMIARFYRKCDGVIYPTTLAKNDFDGYHFKNKQVIVSNGVDTQRFSPAGHMHNDSFTLLFVGRLDQEKNIPVILQAIHLLAQKNKLNQNFRCDIVGSWSEEQKLRALAEKLHIEKIVRFLGKRYGEDLVDAYQRASTYILPSRFELESMTTLEAMACGCPLLISDSPHNAAKFFVKNNWYLFHEDDPHDLASKLSLMIDNPDTLETFRQNSIQNIGAFAFTKSVHSLSDFFSSCIR